MYNQIYLTLVQLRLSVPMCLNSKIKNLQRFHILHPIEKFTEFIYNTFTKANSSNDLCRS